MQTTNTNKDTKPVPGRPLPPKVERLAEQLRKAWGK